MPSRKYAAGIVVVRTRQEQLEFLLVHPGGPYYTRRDDGVWSIPKGLMEDGESPLQAAQREFVEETGFVLNPGSFVDLGEIRQGGGKVVRAFAARGDFNVTQLKSESFEVEWPPRSGQRQSFPEVDRAAYFSLDQSRSKVVRAQFPLLERAQALGRLWISAAGGV